MKKPIIPTKVRIAVQDFTKYGKGNWKTRSHTITTDLGFEQVVEQVFQLVENLEVD